MFGAFGLKKESINGEILLNLDSEEEGELYIGCAGGEDVTATFQYKEVEPEDGDIAIKVNLKGLRGGHSGLEINKGRANANKLMVRFLREAVASYEARLVTWEGGNMRNAIPREAHGVANLFTYGNVNTSTAESSQSGYQKKKQSVFGSAQIGYKSLVYLDLTAREDWVSTINKPFFYPTIGLSGIVTDIFNCSTDIMPYMHLQQA